MLPIVPVHAKHAASYRDCLDVVAREKNYLAQIEALRLDRMQDFVRDNAAGDAIQFFARDGERVVGRADIFPGRALPCTTTESPARGVHPLYRRQGLGTRLLRVCIDRARRQGITRTELEARSDNRRAIALFEKLGFEREALKPRALCFDGVHHDAVQMRLLRGDARAGAAQPASERFRQVSGR